MTQKIHRESRKLIHKLRYFKEEWTDHDEVWSRAKHAFLTEVNILQSRLRAAGFLNNEPESNVADPKSAFDGDPNSSDENFDLEPGDEICHPEWAKKLYKKIALETHPDRFNNLNLPEADKRSRLKNFQLCRQALEDEEYGTLLDVAMLLELDFEISEEHADHISKLAEKFENQIKNIRNTVEYIWFNAVSDDQRKIMALFFQQQGLPNPFDLPVTESLSPARRKTGQRPDRKTGQRPEPLNRRPKET